MDYYNASRVFLGVCVLIGFGLEIYAQSHIRSVFKKYGDMTAHTNLPAARIAEGMLKAQGIADIQIERIAGTLTDNYNPRTGVLSLSECVYDSASIAALGVAAHEVGHVFQHYDEYAPLRFRSVLVPVAQIGSSAALPLLMLGLFFGVQPLIMFGIVVFAAVTLFYAVTLPVEYNASARAVLALEDGGYVTRDEARDAKRVLNAAGLTYVLAALQALLQLARLIGLSGNRRRNN